MNYLEIYQGDTVGLTYDLTPIQDMTGWACRLMVKKTITGEPLIDRELTTLSDDNQAVIGSLTEVETAALSVGTHYVLGKLSNGTQSKEIHHVMRVQQRGVFIP